MNRIRCCFSYQFGRGFYPYIRVVKDILYDVLSRRKARSPRPKKAFKRKNRKPDLSTFFHLLNKKQLPFSGLLFIFTQLF